MLQRLFHVDSLVIDNLGEFSETMNSNSNDAFPFFKNKIVRL